MPILSVVTATLFCLPQDAIKFTTIAFGSHSQLILLLALSFIYLIFFIFTCICHNVVTESLYGSSDFPSGVSRASVWLSGWCGLDLAGHDMH